MTYVSVVPGCDIMGSTETKTSPYTKFISMYRRLLEADEKNIGSTLKNIQELITFNEMIMKSSAIAEVFFYFCINGASTSWTLQNELQMPEATTYRALKRLKTMKVVVPALRVSSRGRNSRGGPRPTVWALQETDDTEVAAALKLHYNLLSPKYCVAQKIAQTILEEYRGKQLNEIRYSDLVLKVRKMKTPFSNLDIANLAATYIAEQGIKVSRYYG